MLCENCGKNEATGYMEKTVNGVKTRLHLCQKCIMEKQKEMFSSAFGMFAGFNEPIVGKSASCPKCGRKLKDIVASGFVGCEYCYSELGDKLLPVIKNIQNATAHVGLTPEGAAAGGKSPATQQLEAQLKKAVEEENYEQAAVFSAQLKKLREEKNVRE